MVVVHVLVCLLEAGSDVQLRCLLLVHFQALLESMRAGAVLFFYDIRSGAVWDVAIGSSLGISSSFHRTEAHRALNIFGSITYLIKTWPIRVTHGVEIVLVDVITLLRWAVARLWALSWLGRELRQHLVGIEEVGDVHIAAVAD